MNKDNKGAVVDPPYCSCRPFWLVGGRARLLIEGAQKNLKEAVELYLEDRPKSKKFLLKEAPLVTTLELGRI